MDKVLISEQGRAIVEACETKVKLQDEAEALTLEAHQLLRRLQEISNQQYTILQNMRDLDLKIEYLAKSC